MGRNTKAMRDKTKEKNTRRQMRKDKKELSRLLKLQKRKRRQ